MTERWFLQGNTLGIKRFLCSFDPESAVRSVLYPFVLPVSFCKRLLRLTGARSSSSLRLSFCRRSFLLVCLSPSFFLPCSLVLFLPLLHVPLFPSYFPPPSLHGRPLGNAIVAATLDTAKSPTIPISTLRRPKLASRLAIQPNVIPPARPPPHPPSLPAFSVPCYYQAPSPSRNDGTTSGCCAEGRLGRKGKFLVRVQTHWRLLSCCRHVLRGV